jgi:hypothetical protein
MSTPTQQADNLYLRSREELLPFEDALFNSLLQGTANYYATRNDNSIFGEILRAVAIELAKMDYYYAYDQVKKNAQFLTPPDIRRQWANPLFVSNIFPQVTQSDLAYRTMLVELIQAYLQGATVKALEAIIFAYTGLTIQVIELYKLIGQGFFDQSDRNAISVSIGVGGTNPLEDITNLNQLQAITQTLYGAIDLGKPAHVGLELATVFGSDENIDLFVTACSTFVNDEPHVVAFAGSPADYIAVASGTPFGVDLGVALEPNSIVLPTWNSSTQYAYPNAVTFLGNYYFVRAAASSPPPPIGTVPTNLAFWSPQFVKVGSSPGPNQYAFVLNGGVGTYHFNAANLGQTVSLSYSWASNPTGICDLLRIFVQLVEEEPSPMLLYLAPDLLPTTPATGLAPVAGWPTNAFWGFGQTYNAPTISPSFPGNSILDPNGFVQLATTSGTSYPYWVANHTYSIGNKIRDLNNNIQTVTAITGDDKSGLSVPPFSGILGGTTVDNHVTWTMTAIFAFSQVLGSPTIDGTVVWTNEGRPPGILAPHIDMSWEISGGDTFNGFLLV